ncbi:thermonuclease family protein [Immundisolibacter sp.]|uniref:thermonuclease family protein n=1 Tax=Immundisolibacter sp. TaxID=1934948 RepID=UPI00260CB985|nr:thermonuclease family protein [Immundisolibacter sp.]MDD3651960.1 thermonuclease family protein [Immundisolibacter sp.]
MPGRLAGLCRKGRLLAPFAFLAALAWVAAAAAGCRPPSRLESATVASHYDGDTLRLADGRRVRLLGIDAPEMNYHKGAPQPLAGRALDRLRTLAPTGGPLRLAYDRQTHDRYGRDLAHTFRPDGINVEETLLREGLAVTFIMPPNTSLADCLLAAERQARLARRGLWALPAYNPLPAVRVPADGNYHVLRGRVTSARRRGDWVLLKVDQRVQLRIARADWSAFEPADHRAWRGRTVIARGKIQSRNGRPQLRVWHPSQIEWSY